MLLLRHQQFSLPFHHPFTIAKGTKTQQPTLIVSLASGPIFGLGEAPAISYYDETIESMMASVEKVRGVIERYALMDPQRFWHFLHHLIPGQSFLTAALDMASWDFFGRMRRKPLWQLIGAKWEAVPVTDLTIGLDTPKAMLQKIAERPWPVYKIKLAQPEDIDILRTLRAATAAPFRVDMNEGWNYDDTLRLLPELQKLDVVLIEQPLPKAASEEMKALKAQSHIPLIADEACQVEADVAKCAEGFHGINIKLTKCGGITPALRMIAEARQRGLKVMLGSMNESSIGSAALAHLAPLADYLDADGPLLLAQDVADGLRYNEDGSVQVSAAPGLGIRYFGEARSSNPFASAQ